MSVHCASAPIPASARRYQLMVRNNEKHKQTGGWGYAVFDRDGTESQTTAACHACHQLVPERGLVFSQPMQLAIGSYGKPAHLQASRVEFVTRGTSALSHCRQSLLD